MMGNNYTYIIASVPALNPEFRPGADFCSRNCEWILSQLSPSDAQTARKLMDGFTPGNLSEDYYAWALKSRNSLIRQYFAADLRLRNAKAEYLNSSIGRPSGTDTIHFSLPDSPEDDRLIKDIFRISNLLEREKAIDGFLWEKLDSLVILEGFSFVKVLSIVAKLMIIDRWVSLDAETGHEMLRRLVGDLRNTYGKIEYTIQK